MHLGSPFETVLSLRWWNFQFRIQPYITVQSSFTKSNHHTGVFMKRFAIVGGILLSGMLGVLNADEKDLKELEGSYSVTTLEKGGKPAEKEKTQTVKVTFKGDNLIIAIEGVEKKAKIKIDTSKQPWTMDISPTDVDEKGRIFPGIYKIEKGEVTLAFTEKTERPKEFKVENDVILMKLKKDEKK